MSDIQKYDHFDPKGHLCKINERQDENARMLENATINVFYSEMAGSDPLVMDKIAQCLESNLPFGLKCQRSRVVFIPHVYKAYWLWSDGEGGPVFTYKDKRDLISGVKMQYLSHKEFIGTAELVALAKIIFYEHALDNLELFQRHLLSQPAQQAGSLGTGPTGNDTGRVDGNEVPECPGSATDAIVLPKPIPDVKDLPIDRGGDAHGVGR